MLSAAASDRSHEDTDEPPWLRRLDRLHGLLLADGFVVGPDRWINVCDLIVRLTAERRLPKSRETLQASIGPLLCRSPDEQQRFAVLFAAWHGCRESVRHQQVRASNEVDSANGPGDSVGVPLLRRRAFIIGAVAATVAIGLLVWWLTPEPAVSDTVPEPAQVLEPPRPLADIPDTDWQTIPLEPMPPRGPRLKPGPTAQQQRALDAANWWLPAIPLVFLVAWLAWVWRWRRTVLSRWRGDRSDPFRRITLAGVFARLFDSAEAATGLRRLHAPVAVPTRRLDVWRTVQATVRRGGLFTPVHQVLSSVPEVLLLVESAHQDDHLTGIGGGLETQMKATGLDVCRYHYQQSPDVVFAPDGSETLTIHGLAERHADARLVIVGSAAPFYDALNRRLLPWVERFDEWCERGLLVPRAPAAELARLLDEGGFAVEPLNSSGVAALGARLANSAATTAAAERPPAAPGPLTDKRWVSDVKPSPQSLKQLLQALRGYLAPPGMLLLSAVAVYPALHWGLTRALDNSLFPYTGQRRERERRLLLIASLPWSREGWMPNWLRLALQQRLDGQQRERIAQVYRQLLERATTEHVPGIELPVAFPEAKRATRQWRHFYRVLRQESPPDSVLQDRILARTVLGRRVSPLDFELPRWLARWLPRGALTGVVPAAAVSGALALFLSASVSWLWQVQGAPWVQRAFTQRQIAANSSYGVVLTAGEGLADHGVALAGNLRDFGFRVDAATEPAVGIEENAVLYSGPDMRTVAEQLADRVRYVTWGEPVSVSEVEPLATPQESSLNDLPASRTLQVRLATARQSGGAVFTDSMLEGAGPRVFRDRFIDGTGDGPAMIQLTGGRFDMGCLAADQADCPYEDELPAHSVNLMPFTIGVAEVSFEEFDRFADASGRQRPNDEGWGRGRRPVINVSFDDALAYAAWLSEQTGENYRLPSEAEWEFAARGGTRTPFSTGASISTDVANYNGNRAWADAVPATGVYRQKTTPSGTFAANPFGLFDVHGNVWEWVADCWHDNYEGAPADGAAWADDADCDRRVVRGGSWFSIPESMRSAFRLWYSPVEAYNSVGFRLARTP